ncbi:hypothetical protein L1049_017022 [Liquidambar formosana]|uniref:Putative plant transposon protein domain-containing protein n=1 Tax=Liquidambar formosana TaxID=63359 RepID=A0AAP0X762_LIQFO
MTQRTEKLLKASMDASRAQTKRKGGSGTSQPPPSNPTQEEPSHQQERRSKAKHSDEGLCKDAETLKKYQDSYKNRRAIGWDFFLTLNNTCYPRLVRVFYANFKFTKDYEIKSWVKGTPIHLRISTIAAVFNLPTENTIQSFDTHGWTIRPDFDKIQALRQICNDSTIQQAFLPSVNDMTVTSRIIHHIISYNLMPRAGSRSYVGYMDIFLIWCVLNGKMLDLAFIILYHMRDCAKKSSGCLPYGNALTEVFKIFDVNMGNETDAYNAKASDIYDKATLKRMKFVQNANGEWTRDPRFAHQQPHEEDPMDEEHEDEPQPPPAEQEDAPSLQTVMTAIGSLHMTMTQGFQDVGNRITDLERRQGNVETILQQYAPYFPPPPED